MKIKLGKIERLRFILFIVRRKKNISYQNTRFTIGFDFIVKKTITKS